VAEGKAADLNAFKARRSNAMGCAFLFLQGFFVPGGSGNGGLSLSCEESAKPERSLRVVA